MFSEVLFDVDNKASPPFQFTSLISDITFFSVESKNFEPLHTYYLIIVRGIKPGFTKHNGSKSLNLAYSSLRFVYKLRT